MKKISLWAGIIGALLVVAFVLSGANSFTHPTDLTRVNMAINVSNLLWIGLGVFLIFIYLKTKQKEDAGYIAVKPEPDSAADIELLSKKRNWIFGFVLLIQILGSAQTWILNDYTAGLTLINAEVIFDVLINIVFAYIIIELFRNKKNVLGLLFYTAIIFGLGEGIIDMFRYHWFGAVLTILMSAYFVFAIKAPLNRKNHRIAHLIILPTFFVFAVASQYFDNGNIEQLTKNDVLLEQQYVNNTNTLSSTYNLVLQKETPSSSEIQDVLDAKIKRDAKIQEVVVNFEALKAEYQKQLPNLAQQEMFERIRYFITIININKAQGDKVEELMKYLQKVDLSKLSDTEKTDISSLKKEVDSFNTQITDMQFKLNNSNLNN